MKPRVGFSLVELIVTLTILSVGVLGLAGAAVVGQRTLAGADATERGVEAATIVLDSLMQVPSPAAGSRILAGAELNWTVTGDARTRRIDLLVRVADGGPGRTLSFHAVHRALAPR